MVKKKTNSADNPLTEALKSFEATEANLSKLERLWNEISEKIPDGIVFGTNAEYEDRCRAYVDVLAHLPTIDGWRPTSVPMPLNEIAQYRFDAQEIQEISAIVAADEAIFAPGDELREYRFRLNKKRKVLVKDALNELVNSADSEVKKLKNKGLHHKQKERLSMLLAQMDTLLGGGVKRPERWNDMHRHLRFGEPHDYKDIVSMDWPSIKSDLQQSVYEADDPIPVNTSDLGTLVASKPQGSVSSKLNWEKLTDEDFERLLFNLMSTDGYENPLWLTKTKATDKGRDLSVDRVAHDTLTGTIRTRVIVQCRHWLTKSIGVDDIAGLKERMRLWEPPRVDVLILATSGRFATDAVAWIEKHNQSDSGLRIEMWPESHLERLLASRPHFIAQFGLR